MRTRAIVWTAAVAFAALVLRADDGSIGNDEADGAFFDFAAATGGFRPYAWANPEVASAHVTRGKIASVRPVFILDAGAGCRLGALGYANVGFWSLSDLSRHYRAERRNCFNELDPWLQYGYTWDFAEGWSLDSRISYQWNEMIGARVGRRTYREWINRETLVTPWFSFFTLVRWMEFPYNCPGIRVGIFREFELPARFSLVPELFSDGGPRCWNRRRFGQWTEEPAKWRPGPNSATLSLTLRYQITDVLSAYVGVSQFSIVDPDIRRQVKARPDERGRPDLAFAKVGLVLSL